MRICAIFVIWACTAATVPTFAAPPKYIATPITPGGSHNVLYCNSISDAGEAHFALSYTLPNGRHSGKFSSDGSYSLAPYPTDYCEYITRTGDMICYGDGNYGLPLVKVRDGVATTLRSPDGQPSPNSMGAGASDGFGNIYGGIDGVATRWSPDGTPTILGQVPNRTTIPVAANDKGMIAGIHRQIDSSDPDPNDRAFIYRNNQFTRIDIPQLHDITVGGIWDDGTVIGSGINSVPDYYGNLGRYIWMWKDGNLSFIEGDPDHPVIQDGVDNPLDAVYGSNTSGWAVGTSPRGGLLFDGSGNSYYINDLLVDRDLAARAGFGYAYAINDSGQIVAKATAFDSPPLTDNWYILTPVPEPAATFPALATMAALTRRRRR
jgi:hypothetical protein